MRELSDRSSSCLVVLHVENDFGLGRQPISQAPQASFPLSAKREASA